MEYQIGDVIRIEGCSETWDGEYNITEVSEERYLIEPQPGGWLKGFAANSNANSKSKLISRVGCKYKVGDVIEINLNDDHNQTWDGLHTIKELHFPYGNDVPVYYKTSCHITDYGFGERSIVGEYSKLCELVKEPVEPFDREKLLSLVKLLHNLESEVWEIIGDQSWDF